MCSAYIWYTKTKTTICLEQITKQKTDYQIGDLANKKTPPQQLPRSSTP